MIFTEKTERGLEIFARTGIFMKGIVYCLIGILTTLAAVGLSRTKASKEEAFGFIYNQPFGRILLVVIGVGLIGYVVWRGFQAIRDIDHKGSDPKALFIRAGYAISALIYLGLGAYAVKLGVQGAGGEGDTQRLITEKVLALPGGSWILGITGAIIAISGVRQIFKAVTKKFLKNISLVQNKYNALFTRAGMVGYISRGIVLVIIAYFFIRAALHRNANEVQGTKGAFDFLESHYGAFLMGIIALGLFGYGFFMLVKSRHQKIDLHF